MSWLHALIIAIVEGVTEFLPISSTGHMIITEKLLGLESDEFVNLFIVNIQLGAILSVVVLYWKRFFKSLKFYYVLFVAFLPAAFFGLLLGKYIDILLESVITVAVSLIVGGIFLLFADKLFSKTDKNQEVAYKKGFFIGLFQVLAMIPGVSRSAATIIGGMAQKLSRKTAAEFSFFLAVPTMLAATLYKLYQNHEALNYDNIDILLFGNIIAFIVAMLSIKFFINFLTKYGFKVFGYYRIIVGAAILILLASGISLQIS
ncbi:MAG: undecaprenyl-diphosphate phosphatase [Bacteroidales bacterium]|nr:undecaprenyl-diphosphate phosphatase [Bacteroidales bacterium]